EEVTRILIGRVGADQSSCTAQSMAPGMPQGRTDQSPGAARVARRRSSTAAATFVTAAANNSTLTPRTTLAPALIGSPARAARPDLRQSSAPTTTSAAAAP